MQLSLLDYQPRARHTDPSTSHVAADHARHFAKDHHTRILRYLASIDPRAATYVEIADGAGLERHAVGRRLPELRNEGLIFIAGTGRLPSGRPAMLYRIAGKGQRRAAA